MNNIRNNLTPRANLDRIYNSLRRIYSDYMSSKPGDTKADQRMLSAIDSMEESMRAFTMNFMEKLLNDSGHVESDHEKLEELRKMLLEIAKEERIAIRKDHYMHKFAKHLKNIIAKNENATKRKGLIKFKDIQKKQKKMKKEESNLKKEKKEAAEQAGMKRAA